ncbi:TolC family outer membrane protein [uncultured Sphingomonas sp.]|uniref:TolC family outer membrane protein n=1 Tax=uncultured Sphingomonas sp. TaxID=158754 RepID=UPI0035CC5802
MIRGLLIAGVALVPLAAPAGAETLREALLRAYESNPQITGQRAAQRALDEDVPIRRADGKPSADAQGQLQEFLVIPGNQFATAPRQLFGQAQVGVPLYQGGAVRNSVRAAETRVEAGRAQLRGTEANLFTNVVAAYMDVIRDDAVVALNRQNVRVLEVNAGASRDRFEVGDLTRTDVAQSEARLAIARAQLQQAEAQLIASREDYINFVGTPAGRLQDPPPLPNLPSTPEQAVAVAIEDNPALQAAMAERNARRFDTGVARAGRLPRVGASIGGSYSSFLGSVPSGGFTQNSATAATAGLNMSLPIFQGGRPAAQVRQAQARESQAIENVTLQERNAVSQTRSALAIYRGSVEVIGSSEVAVNANKLALEGVRAENGVGTRTVLEVLNAEQELLNSQVTLVTARRDAYVAGFALLAAMGNAEARDLGLGGGALYDPTVNYRRVRGKIWDFGGDPTPVAVATGTATTPAQGAEVSRSLDPLLDSGVDRRPGLTTGNDAPDRR